MKKIIVFGVFMLLIALALPTSIAELEKFATSEDDVELDISAGFRGKDIGIGFAVYLLNHKTENVTVFFNVTFNYLFMKGWDFSDGWKETLSPELPYYGHISCALCIPDGMKFVSITVEVEGKVLTRNGFSIGNLLILFK
jgi:hypothetical protein